MPWLISRLIRKTFGDAASGDNRSNKGSKKEGDVNMKNNSKASKKFIGDDEGEYVSFEEVDE